MASLTNLNAPSSNKLRRKELHSSPANQGLERNNTNKQNNISYQKKPEIATKTSAVSGKKTPSPSLILQRKSVTSEVGNESTEANPKTSSQLPIAKARVTSIPSINKDNPQESGSLPLVKANLTPLIQRQSETILRQEKFPTNTFISQGKKNQKTMPTSSPSGEKSLRSELARATTIPVNQSPLNQTNMILRKSTENSSSDNLLGQGITNYQEQPNNSQFLQASNFDQNAPPVVPKDEMNQASGSHNSMGSSDMGITSPPAIDVAQIAEQVSRILSRRLAVERERRGVW